MSSTNTKLYSFIFALLFWLPALGQQRVIANVLGLTPSALPFACSKGDVRFDTVSSSLQICASSNTWTSFSNVGNGGTGRTSLTNHSVLLGAGTSPVNFAGPGTTGYLLTAGGASSDPTFSQLNLGTSAAITGTLPIANGGTGAATQQAAINALTGTQSAGTYLRSDGTNATLSAIQAADLPAVSSLAGGALGSTFYQSAASTTALLAGNTTTTKKFLTQTGTGSASAAPSWLQPACGDLSNAAASCSTDTTNASNISSGTLPAGRLPNPSSSTLGGVQSAASVSHQWVNSISTSGVPALSQPAFSDISGTATNSQLADMANNTVKGNTSGGSAAPSDLTLSSAATASSVVYRDSNGNSAFNRAAGGYATTATAGGTTTLSASSAYNQYFTGTSNQTVKMPDATTMLQTGDGFRVVNLSTGTLTIQDNSAGAITSITGSGVVALTAKSISSAAGSWDAVTAGGGAGTGTVTSVTFTGDGTVLSSTPSSAVTTSGTVTATLNTQSANKILAGPTSGSAAAPTFRSLAPSDTNAASMASPSKLLNLGLTYSITSNALTVNIVQADGSTTPTAANPATYFTRNATATTGGYVQNAVTGAKSMTISANTTLGLVSSVNNYVYFYGSSDGNVLASTSIVDEMAQQSYIPESAALTSISNANPAVFTLAGHGFNQNDAITLTTTGSLPTGLSTGTVYFVLPINSSTFNVSTTPGGSAVVTSSAGSGTHSYHVASNKLVCGNGVTGNSGIGVKLLGRMKFNITAGTWAAPSENSTFSGYKTPIAPTIQKFTSGSGTYVTPTGVTYLHIRMVGGGAGGAGGGTSAAGNGTAGGNTTFGTSMLTANGAPTATAGAVIGGAGGTASVSSPAIGTAFTGGGGGSSSGSTSTTFATGGMGGSSPFGGAGIAGTAATVGSAAIANTGSGGGGGGANTSLNDISGAGGGAGGYIDAMLTSPSATYPYAIGSGGSGGAAGSGSSSGGTNGAAGIIIVEEYYN